MYENIDEYFSGRALFGNDFGSKEIKEWFDDEKEGYADLGPKDNLSYNYGYHALNTLCGLSKVRHMHGARVLGFGAAYGDELLPLKENISEIVVLDPSDSFVGKSHVFPNSITWKKPDVSGDLDFPDESFDLVTSHGVLHHVPNVGHVLKEIYRCTKNGGYFLLREPVVSMGDWRKPRRGLTKRERGIPEHLLLEMCESSGFEIERKTFCMFAPYSRIVSKFGLKTPVYNSRLLTYIDLMFSKLFSFNKIYHRTSFFSKFGPACVYLVLHKK